MKLLLMSMTFLLMNSSAWAIEWLRDGKLASPNPEAIVRALQDNKKKADYHFARKHIGLELLVAEGTFAQPESISGHSFLRFIDEDENPLNDTIVSFNMLPLDPSKMYEKSFGGFPNVPMIGSFAETMISYMRSENRPIRRYIIPTTPQFIANLKTIIRQVIEAPSLMNDYHFTQNNCLTGIIKIFKYVGYPIHELGLVDIPSTAGNSLMINSMAFYPESPTMLVRGGSDLITRINDEFEKGFIARKWNSEEKGTFLNQEPFWNSLENWSEQDLERLLTFWPFDWNSQYPRMQKIADAHIQNHHPLLQIIGIKQLPDAIYQLCNIDDVNCREARKQAAIENYGEQAMRDHLKYATGIRNYEISRTKQLANDFVMNEKLQLLNNPVALELVNFANDFKK